ncbi:MAG TPA: hypothetical protein VMF53_09950 [Alphaproteobacteria bacterium]|nr:hypothetical protein [Alphaproteobacteria bacterium]
MIKKTGPIVRNTAAYSLDNRIHDGIVTRADRPSSRKGPPRAPHTVLALWPADFPLA